ncbi:MAG: hypothetical protein PHS85_01895 [Sulfurovum sp.]|nr:hypothetical protein [Sulfurovum sp.]
MKEEQKQEQKIYIKIDDEYLEIVDGVEYEIPLNQAKELGFDENSEGDDDGSEQ